MVAKIKEVAISAIGETGRYRVIVSFNGERREYAACLIKDEYDGWSEFHCTYRGGAMMLYLLRKGSRWLSKDRRFTVLECEMVTRAEYCRLLDKICHGFHKRKVG